MTDQNKPQPSDSALAKIAICMGSQSDWPTMSEASKILDGFGIAHESLIISAHRTPDRLSDFAKQAADKGFQVIIAGAGGAAHLPGMIASHTHLPVLGVPVESKSLKGMDSLLSIVQMPAGIPVGTLAIGVAGAKNAAILAAEIIALQDETARKAVIDYRAAQTNSVADKPVDEI